MIRSPSDGGSMVLPPRKRNGPHLYNPPFQFLLDEDSPFAPHLLAGPPQFLEPI